MDPNVLYKSQSRSKGVWMVEGLYPGDHMTDRRVDKQSNEF